MGGPAASALILAGVGRVCGNGGGELDDDGPARDCSVQFTTAFLVDGRVIAANGYADGAATPTAEGYDPALRTWTPAAT